MEWVKLDEFPNFEVSDCGFVRNKKGRILKPILHHGCMYVNVNNKERRVLKSIKSLVINNFCCYADVNNVILNVDGDINNNSLDNLLVLNKTETVTNGFKKTKGLIK